MYNLIVLVWTKLYQDEPEWTHVVREADRLTSAEEEEVITKFYENTDDFDYDDDIDNVWSNSVTKVDNYEVKLYKEF